MHILRGNRGSSAFLTTMKMGMNLGTMNYFNTEPVFIDLMRQANPFTDPAITRHAALDSDGWPTEDFTFGQMQRLPYDEPLSQSYTVIIDGNAGSVSMSLANFWALGTVAYNSGTDTTTIALTGPNDRSQNMEGCMITCTGTKRTPASATGSGVRGVRMARHGYESRLSEVVTDEFKVHCASFTHLRYMKPQNTELNAATTSWADRKKQQAFGNDGSNAEMLSVEDIVAISNATNTNPWICVPGTADGTLGTASWEYGAATYIEANLNPGLVAVYEYCNETWNFGYQWYAYGCNQVAQEIHGFWNDGRGIRQVTSFNRVSNVVTLTFNTAHGLTTGDTYLIGNVTIGGNPQGGFVTITVTSSTTITYPDAGTDGAVTHTSDCAGGSATVVTPITFDGSSYYPAAQSLAERWMARRRLQMSDNIRLAVGDSKMMTRHNPVYMGQDPGLYRIDDARSMFAYMGTTLAAKFRAVGGGGYIFGINAVGFRVTTDYSVTHTAQEYIDGYVYAAQHGQNDYAFDAWKAFTLGWGVELWMYELGTDTKMYVFGDTTNYAANAVQLRLATLDPQWTQAEQPYVEWQARLGVDLGMEFNMEMGQINDYSGGGYWGMAYSPSIVSAKQQAYINFATNKTTYQDNIVPGTVDGRSFIHHYNYGALPYPRLSSGAGQYLQYGDTSDITATVYETFPADRLVYLVNARVAKSYTLAITYKTLIATAQSVSILLNGSSMGTISLPNLGVGNVGTSGTVSLTLAYGAQNCVQVIRANNNNDFEIQGLVFV